MNVRIWLLLGALGSFSCRPIQSSTNASKDVVSQKEQPSENGRLSIENENAPSIALVGGTVLTAEGTRFENGTVLLDRGQIVYVGKAIEIPEATEVVDVSGRFVTPGLIDTHSHLGVYANPGDVAHSDGNEMTNAVTADVKAKYGYWPQDPGIIRARAHGVTTALILPGSANLVGGEGFTVVMKPGRSNEHVAFPGAPRTIKMACGENPKRVYEDKGGPSTRMGIYADFRKTFGKARDRQRKMESHKKKHAKWEQNKKGERPQPPGYDAKMDTLAAVLRGEVLVQIHCYRASEIREMVRIADEFGFPIRSFHHALEAYKVRDILVEKNIAINTWADWWGFKLEAFDGIPMNAALFFESGGRAVIHSDSAIGIQRLNQEVAKVLYQARAKGLAITDDEALRWITKNAAWVIGLQDVVGSLSPGKRADVVIWDRHPFSTYATVDLVVQGGEVVYDKKRGTAPTDFELGNSYRDIFSGEK